MKAMLCQRIIRNTQAYGLVQAGPTLVGTNEATSPMFQGLLFYH
jgi:hypothetical protein